jgi:hypothetical protein
MMRDLLLLVIAATAIWVAIDASKRDWSRDKRATSPLTWALGCLLFWIVVFPMYLVKRRRAPIRTNA